MLARRFDTSSRPRGRCRSLGLAVVAAAVPAVVHQPRILRSGADTVPAVDRDGSESGRLEDSVVGVGVVDAVPREQKEDLPRTIRYRIVFCCCGRRCLGKCGIHLPLDRVRPGTAVGAVGLAVGGGVVAAAGDRC